jgi:serine/threonine protein kinase
MMLPRSTSLGGTAADSAGTADAAAVSPNVVVAADADTPCLPFPFPPQLALNDILTEACIGKGSFSKVYKIRCSSSGGGGSGQGGNNTIIAAMKCLDPKQIGKSVVKHDMATHDIEYESTILSRLDHENIIKLCAISPQLTQQQQQSQQQQHHQQQSHVTSSTRRKQAYQKKRSSSIGHYFVMELLDDTLDARLQRWRYNKEQQHRRRGGAMNNSFTTMSSSSSSVPSTATSTAPSTSFSSLPSFNSPIRMNIPVLKRGLSFGYGSTSSLPKAAVVVAPTTAEDGCDSDTSQNNNNSRISSDFKNVRKASLKRFYTWSPTVVTNNKKVALKTKSLSMSMLSFASSECSSTVSPFMSDSEVEETSDIDNEVVNSSSATTATTTTTKLLEEREEAEAAAAAAAAAAASTVIKQREEQLDRVRQVIPGLASALSYLHNQDLVFRDIKPQNVGFASSKTTMNRRASNSSTVSSSSSISTSSPPSKKEETVKLYDFGLCRHIDECSDDEIAGTYRYMAPERMVFQVNKSSSPSTQEEEDQDDDDDENNDSAITSRRRSNLLKAADVYGLGVLMWEIATLERPYQQLLSTRGMMRSDLHTRLAVEGWRHNTADMIHCPKLRSVIEQCWHVDPTQRPSMDQVCQMMKDLLSSSTSSTTK